MQKVVKISGLSALSAPVFVYSLAFYGFFPQILIHSAAAEVVAEVVAGEKGGAPERKAARPSQKTTGGRGFLPKKSGFCGGKIGFLRND